jgi:thymidylate kinase
LIIVLEGVNGTGKSTYAEKLSKGLTAPVIRPFRQGPDHHFTGTTHIERELKALGVPYNTHVDDLYTADILGRLLKFNKHLPVILDRSVGSAIAHGERPLRDAGRLIGLWQQLLGPDTQLLYVWLTAPYSIAADRLLKDKRGAEESSEAFGDHKRLHGLFRYVFEMVRHPKLEIDTATIAVDDGVLQIIELMNGQTR